GSLRLLSDCVVRALSDLTVQRTERKSIGKVSSRSAAKSIHIHIFDHLHRALTPPEVQQLAFLFADPDKHVTSQVIDDLGQSSLLIFIEPLPRPFTDQDLDRRLDM